MFVIPGSGSVSLKLNVQYIEYRIIQISIELCECAILTWTISSLIVVQRYNQVADAKDPGSNHPCFSTKCPSAQKRNTFWIKNPLPLLGIEPTNFWLPSACPGISFIKGFVISAIDRFPLIGSHSSREMWSESHLSLCCTNLWFWCQRQLCHSFVLSSTL